MPQMAPISWLILFLVFSITLIMFNFLNYFIYSPSLPQSTPTQQNLTNSMNWKW